jgi:hypothetical protein
MADWMVVYVRVGPTCKVAAEAELVQSPRKVSTRTAVKTATTARRETAFTAITLFAF